jgi:hypothetical protein
MLRVAAEYDCAWPIKQRFLNFKMSQIKSLDSLRTFVIENEDEKQKNIREPRGIVPMFLLRTTIMKTPLYPAARGACQTVFNPARPVYRIAWPDVDQSDRT